MPTWFRTRPVGTAHADIEAHEAHLSMLRCWRGGEVGTREVGGGKLVGKASGRGEGREDENKSKKRERVWIVRCWMRK
jgi:hypothetical protein